MKPDQDLDPAGQGVIVKERRPEHIAPAPSTKSSMESMRDLPVLSASSLHTYLDCPQMWKLRYVDRRPQPKRWYLNLGTAVHAALERFYRGRVAAPATIQEMLESFEEKLDPEAYTSAEDLDRARADGHQMVRDFHAAHAPDFQPAARVELPIRFVFESERFRGYVDRVDRTADGGVRIVDYKTGGRLTLSRAREDDQLTIYQIGVEEELGLPVRSVALYDVRSQILLEVERHGEHRVEALRRKVRRVARAIRAGEFEPRPGRNCEWCDYKVWCPAFAHLYPENWIQEPLPPAPTHAEASELADRYGRLKNEIRDRARELAETKRDLRRFFAATGERVTAGDQFEVRAASVPGYRFDDDALRQVLQPAGLWEQVLRPDWRKKEALLADPDVPDDVATQMKAIGERGVRWQIRYRELVPHVA